MHNKLEDLNEIFDNAVITGMSYVFIGIKAEGVREVISIPKDSFEKKRAFYNEFYTEDWKNKRNPNIEIEFVYNGHADELSTAEELWDMLDGGEFDE